LRSVVDGQFLVDLNSSTRGDLIWTHVPQIWIAAVVAEVNDAVGWQDEMGVLVDGESVHVDV